VFRLKKKPKLDPDLLIEEQSTEAATAGVTVLLVEDNKATRYQRVMYRFLRFLKLIF
jgi:hypothetical protein